MKELSRKIEDAFAAAAFAEAGEFDAARQMLGETASDNPEKEGSGSRQGSMAGQPSEA